MANITIGGNEYDIPEMNFLAVELAWPHVLEATNVLDPVRGTSAALAVIAAAIQQADYFDPANFNIEVKGDREIHQAFSYYLKKQLKATEIGRVKETMFEILKEAGLEVTEGEAVAALMAALGPETEDQNPSPETAPDTSSSSSPPDAKGEAGTR